MWCKPEPSSVSPIYIPGRFRTASKPLRTLMDSAPYSGAARWCVLRSGHGCRIVVENMPQYRELTPEKSRFLRGTRSVSIAEISDAASQKAPPKAAVPSAQPEPVAGGHAEPEKHDRKPGASGANGMSPSGNVIRAAAMQQQRHQVHERRLATEMCSRGRSSPSMRPDQPRALAHAQAHQRRAALSRSSAQPGSHMCCKPEQPSGRRPAASAPPRATSCPARWWPARSRTSR